MFSYLKPEPQESDDVSNLQQGTDLIPQLTSMEAQLRYIYEDLSRTSQIVSDNVILHRADRDLSPGIQPVRGKSAVHKHEVDFIAATCGTLKMDVESISTTADFGAVLGTIRAGPLIATVEDKVAEDGSLVVKEITYPGAAISFCGLWRFVDGQAVEHWENASEPGKLVDWLMGAASFLPPDMKVVKRSWS